MSRTKTNPDAKRAKAWEKKAEAWRDYANALESERNELIEELSSISAGFVLTDQPCSWSTETKLRDRASKKVAKFAKREHPKKPQGYFYL